MRKFLVLLLPLMLLLGACGSDGESDGNSGDGPLDSIKITSTEDNQAPGVEFDKPLTVDAPAAKVVQEGDGDEITEGQRVSMLIDVVNTVSGESQQPNGFTENKTEELFMNEETKTNFEPLYNALVGSKVGSYVAFAAPGQQQQVPAPEGQTPAPTPTQAPSTLLILKVTEAKTLPTRAEGEAVPPKEGLPTVTLAENGKPTITVPKTDPPKELVSQNLINGDGAEVKKTDTVTVNYEGVKWSDGSVFDSSWEREPATFPLQNVIAGWTEGLNGKKVGDQVLLVVPPKDGYGTEGNEQHELAKETLVFVVDILDVQPGQEQPAPESGQ